MIGHQPEKGVHALVVILNAPGLRAVHGLEYLGV
jgi:hypothetical protein